MKRAKNVAEAVKTRSSLTSWYCMGPRRRNVSSLSNSKDEDVQEAPLMTERTEGLVADVVTREQVQNIEYSSSSGDGSEDDQEEQIMPVNGGIAASTVEGITEGALWYELEKELKRQEVEVDIQAQKEEAAAVEEITKEENVLANGVESEIKTAISSSDVTENHHFYPPGRIRHMVSVPSSEDVDMPVNEHVGIYETPRKLYSKIRLSRTMINDHYMPMYKKMMEQLITQLENDEAHNCAVIIQEQ